jgi:carboxylesterase
MTHEIIRNPHLEGGTFFWEGGPVGVLLIHGYTATTAKVRLLGRFLHERSYTVSGPLLPGHGTTPEDMNRCRWQDWTGAVEQAYRQICARCDRVFVGGESMGALLALYTASEHPEVTGVLVYAPALRVRPGVILMARLLAPFVPITYKRRNAVDAVADERWQGYAANPVRAAVQLGNLQQHVRRRLPRIRQPLLIVQGRLDTSIDPRSAEMVRREAGSPVKELHWMEHSTHCVILDREWQQASALTLSFIERTAAQVVA